MWWVCGQCGGCARGGGGPTSRLPPTPLHVLRRRRTIIRAGGHARGPACRVFCGCFPSFTREEPAACAMPLNEAASHRHGGRGGGRHAAGGGGSGGVTGGSAANCFFSLCTWRVAGMDSGASKVLCSRENSQFTYSPLSASRPRESPILPAMDIKKSSWSAHRPAPLTSFIFVYTNISFATFSCVRRMRTREWM